MTKEAEHRNLQQMTDPNPLILIANSAEPDPPRLLKRPATLDETIERCVGGFGWKQFLQALLVSFAWAFDAQQVFISVFTDAEPKWHCTRNSNYTCNQASDICQLPKEAWDWNFPVYVSTVSEWSLECGSSLITGLPASAFYIGCLAGGLILASLADSSLGRKNTLVLSCLAMSITGALTAASPNIWIYTLLRFLSGFGRATLGTSSLVLSTELVGKKLRGQIGLIGFFCFSFGFLSLPALAYLNEGSSWRVLYLWTCLPTLAYCLLVHCVVSESPRWLYVRGQKVKLVETLRSFAPQATRSSLTSSFFGSFIECDEQSESAEATDLYSAIKILWEKTWAFRRLITVMIVSFGIGMIYYGMPLGVGNLGFNNLYLSVTLNALSEVPATLLTGLLIQKLNRRISVLGLTLLSGSCSVMCVMMKWEELQIAVEMISFFSACTSLNVLLIYTLELFPTCVRNSSVSMVRQALVLGGVFSPLLVAAGRNNAVLSYGVFGVTIASCGLFVACLPETKGGTLCDTMDEEEHKERTALNYTSV